MTEDLNSIDFIALAEAGVQLRTRDRRVVGDVVVDKQSGLIRGKVALEGMLTWRRDGSYADAPLNVAGPFDLVAPSAPAPTQRASLRDALNESDGAAARAPFCCD